MIYGIESFKDIKGELIPYTLSAWEEVDQMKGTFELNPDVEAYEALESAGMLRLYTMRVSEGTPLIGYALYIIQPVLHCKGNFHAVSDVMFIDKEYRGLGEHLLTLVQDDLREEGVKWFSFTVKAWLDSGKLAEKLGCQLFESVYQKEL